MKNQDFKYLAANEKTDAIHFLDVNLREGASFDLKQGLILDETKLITPYSRCTSEALTHKGVEPTSLIKNMNMATACKHWVCIKIEE